MVSHHEAVIIKGKMLTMSRKKIITPFYIATQEILTEPKFIFTKDSMIKKKF